MINWIDWSILVIYFLVLLTVLWFYRHKKKESYYKFYLSGFLTKCIGSVAFALIYVYYYKFGDSFEYYKGAVALNEAFFSSIVDYFDLLVSNSSTDFKSHLVQYTGSLAYADTPEEWFMVKLLSPVSVISFKSYLVINFFMGLVSFWGSWKLFKVFADLLPKNHFVAFVTAFLVPSTVFWGSGVMKDTVTMTGVNYIIYVLYFGFIKGNLKWYYILSVPLWFLVTFKLKSYIVLALMPAVIATIYFHVRSRIPSGFLRAVTGPVLFTTLILVSFFSLQSLSESSQKYSASEIEWKVKGIQSWHTDVGGSSYDLGEIEFTPVGIIRKIPESLNVTFFRPYLWEARNPVVLLGAVESLLVLILFLTVLFKTKHHFFSYLKNQSLLKGMLIFVLVFGFSIGFTSYNFGALARYKIPIFSLFIFILFYIRDQYNQSLHTVK